MHCLPKSVPFRGFSEGGCRGGTKLYGTTMFLSLSQSATVAESAFPTSEPCFFVYSLSVLSRHSSPPSCQATQYQELAPSVSPPPQSAVDAPAVTACISAQTALYACWVLLKCFYEWKTTKQRLLGISLMRTAAFSFFLAPSMESRNNSGCI